ncbi:hypothetical protein N0V95_007108 [Ascochyta clinopodiicola]|nr:hypothetical protein N0V95_007108 [Ascochyta clinopodiicola]
MSLQRLPSRSATQTGDTMASYQYRALLPAPKSIRLIQILPAAAGTDVRCYMLDYTIVDEHVPGLYEALSYTWGDWTDPKKIYVADGAAYNQSPDTSFHCLDVTNNLYTAMQHLRDTILPRIIWIDAICISQDNLAERAEQVRFMATIFSHAFRVVVWLGEEQSESAELFATLEGVATHVEHAPKEVARMLADKIVYKDAIQKPLNALLPL